MRRLFPIVSSPQESDDLIALSEERAAELIGASVPTLRGWAGQGLVGATVVRHISPRNTVRLYGFEDLRVCPHPG